MATMSSGTVQTPQRLLIYGPEGIGKSTFAAAMPDPVFLDTENGTLHLMCERYSGFTGWRDLLNTVSVASDYEGASTIVIDTLDSAERMCQEAVCKDNSKSSIEAFGYGKGYVYAKEEFEKLLLALDKCIGKGLNVVMVAHSQMRKFERPDETGAFDRFELKLNKHISALVKEWADAVLFCDYETFVVQDQNGKGKASGGKRVIRTDHNPCWDAKNRWGLPAKLALDSDGIGEVRKHLSVKKPQPQPSSEVQAEPSSSEVEKPKKAKAKAKTGEERVAKIKEAQARFKALDSTDAAPLKELMLSDNVSFDELEALIGERYKKGSHVEEWPSDFVNWAVAQWAAILSKKREQEMLANTSEEDVPF